MGCQRLSDLDCQPLCLSPFATGILKTENECETNKKKKNKLKSDAVVGLQNEVARRAEAAKALQRSFYFFARAGAEWEEKGSGGKWPLHNGRRLAQKTFNLRRLCGSFGAPKNDFKMWPQVI